MRHGGVVGQVWRGGAHRQANVARLPAGVEVAPVDAGLGRRAGVLLGRAATSDVIDAALVLLAGDGDEIVASDLDDPAILAAVAGMDVEGIAS